MTTLTLLPRQQQACKKNLAYLFTLADEVSSNSSVQFVQSANPQAGAYLTYNC